MRTIDAQTRLCGVIGNPVGHSMSPAIHNAGYEALGLNVVYLAFEVEDVAPCLDGVRALGNFAGLSVTIPHKAAVIEHLDELDPMAERVGSVNTISKVEGRLIGSTTDGPGTLRAFEGAGVELSGKRVLFVGSGGAVRAVAFAMAEAAVAEIVVLGRTPANVETLTGDLRAATQPEIRAGNLEQDLLPSIARADVLIQGTPMGMAGPDEGKSPIPPDAIRAEHVVFDMVYNPLETPLIRDAKAAGARTILGIEMLVHQAALQFEGWTGESAPVDVMRAAAVTRLADSRS